MNGKIDSIHREQRSKLVSNVRLAILSAGIHAKSPAVSDYPAKRRENLECIEVGLRVLDALGANTFVEGKKAADDS